MNNNCQYTDEEIKQLQSQLAEKDIALSNALEDVNQIRAGCDFFKRENHQLQERIKVLEEEKKTWFNSLGSHDEDCECYYCNPSV